MSNSEKIETNKQNKEPVKSKKYKNYVLMTFLKLTLSIFACLFIYGIYLDSKIKTKMEGRIWQLPAEIYSQVDTIYVNNHPTLEDVTLALLDNKYREVSKLVTPGDFKIEKNRITLLRRAFSFPQKPESERIIRLNFKQNRLIYMEDLVRGQIIKQLNIEPKLIAMLHSDNDEDRQFLQLQYYPRLLIETLLLIEDKKFYQHNGISFMGIARAIISNYRAGRHVQGGSTLTQQLVKNVFLTNEKTWSRKLNEALMSVILDFNYSKNRILETYLNEIYLGQNGSYQIHGFALASQFYFGRSIQEISLDQLAFLVGIVKGPSLYNPWRNPEKALERRNIVLDVLATNKIIDDKLHKMLINRPLGIKKKGIVYRKQPAFMQALKIELKQKFGQNYFAKLSGAKIFTTLDQDQQMASEMAVINGIAHLENKYKRVNNLQSAMIVAEYKTGKIRSIVGGVETQSFGFNRAIQAKRQIGSLVKPSIYAIALSNPQQFNLNTYIKNSPITIKSKGSPDWHPRNYNRRFSAPVTLLNALVRSMNVPTVNIGMAVGLENIIKKQKEMGWDTVRIPPYPSTLLGAYTISPYEVTKSYQTLANGGLNLPLTTLEAILSDKGTLIYKSNLNEAKQVLPKEAAIQTLYAMQEVVRRGTARRLQNDFGFLNLAGKTGTTNDARDTWYVGIDGKNVVTVWVGKDNNTNTHLTGSSGALPVYQHYLKRLQPEPFVLPNSPNLRWYGVNRYGSWDCSSTTKMPIWTSRSQQECGYQTPVKQEATPQQPAKNNTQEVKPKKSIWDALLFN